MRPIRVPLWTWWKRMAGTDWITAGDGLRPKRDHSWKGIASRDGSRLDMDGWLEVDDCRWITTGYGWMTADGSWEMDHGRWITVDGWQSISFPFRKILRLYAVIPFARLVTMISSYEVTIQRRYADTRCTAGGLVPASTILTTTQSTIQRYRIMHLHAWVPIPNSIPNKIPSYSYNADSAQALRG